MRTVRVLLGLAVVGATSACIARPGTLERSLATGAQWTVALTPTTGSTLHGTITFVRTEPATQTRAIFALNGGSPNSVLPWHIHFGVCGNDRMIVGRPADYPPLVLGSSGNLTAIAQLPVELADGVAYDVHIHASPVDVKTTLACGSLTPERAIAER